MAHGKSAYGKGDRYRPVNRKKWDENYERIFGTRRQTEGRIIISDEQRRVDQLKNLLRQRGIDFWQPNSDPALLGLSARLNCTAVFPHHTARFLYDIPIDQFKHATIESMTKMRQLLQELIDEVEAI